MTTWPQYLLWALFCVLTKSLSPSKTSFTFDEKVQVLRKHNDFRRAVVGANMNKLYWHTGLEILAQKWADNCEWRHNSDRHHVPGLGYEFVGENLYIGTFYRSPTRGLMQWHEERVNLIGQTMGCAQNKQCGHFTQMVWHNAESIGCAIRYCDPMKKSRSTNFAYFLVCEYGPLGNTPYEMYYQAGTPCSDCPASRPTCVDKLCAVPNCNNVQCAHGNLVDDVCMCNCTGSGYEGEKCGILSAGGNENGDANGNNKGSGSDDVAFPNMDSAGDTVGTGLLVMCVICRFTIKLITVFNEP